MIQLSTTGEKKELGSAEEMGSIQGGSQAFKADICCTTRRRFKQLNFRSLSACGLWAATTEVAEIRNDFL